MTLLQNTEDRYGLVASALHWAMAVLIVALAAVGLYMVTLPDVGFNTRKITLILYHKDFGMLVLLLLALRLAWRVTQILPRLVEGLPEWQQVTARFVHLCLYALMFALPLTGWLMSSALGVPVTMLEVFTLPDLIHRQDALYPLLAEVHKWLAYLLLLLLALHAGASLQHHFVARDDTLRRMLPGGSDGPGSPNS